MLNGTLIWLAMWATVPAAGDDGDGRFVVHEWGTFTSFSGSDGVILEHRPTLGVDLPDFVLDRRAWFDAGTESQSGTKQSISAQQRMETPVIYFYTDRARDVRVRVDFPKGLLTEFYPPPDAVGPPHRPDRPVPVCDAFVEWKHLRVVPDEPPAKTPREMAPVSQGDRYGHARETDAALVRTRFDDRDHLEKFLFYRGVGNFRLPVRLRALNDHSIEITSNATEPIAAAFVMRAGAARGDFRFAEYSSLSGRRELRIPDRKSKPSELADAMVKALVRAGLFEREATAMVKTWKDDWFGEPGTRVLFIVPRYVTDALLPLQIEPKPDELIRVLVGRMDILMPEDERRIERTIRGMSLVTPRNGEASRTLSGLGRFVDPALRRIAEVSTDRHVRERAKELLLTIRSPD